MTAYYSKITIHLNLKRGWNFEIFVTTSTCGRACEVFGGNCGYACTLEKKRKFSLTSYRNYTPEISCYEMKKILHASKVLNAIDEMYSQTFFSVYTFQRPRVNLKCALTRRSATAGIWLKSGVKRVHSIRRLVTSIMIATFVDFLSVYILTLLLVTFRLWFVTSSCSYDT